MNDEITKCCCDEENTLICEHCKFKKAIYYISDDRYVSCNKYFHDRKHNTNVLYCVFYEPEIKEDKLKTFANDTNCYCLNCKYSKQLFDGKHIHCSKRNLSAYKGYLCPSYEPRRDSEIPENLKEDTGILGEVRYPRFCDDFTKDEVLTCCCNDKKDIPNQSAKADEGKLQISLVPTQIIRDIAEVRMYGNKKYGDPNNWKSVEKSRYVDALLRHLLAYIDDPESIDEESGIKHYKHMACNMAFICAMEDFSFYMNPPKE